MSALAGGAHGLLEEHSVIAGKTVYLQGGENKAYANGQVCRS